MRPVLFALSILHFFFAATLLAAPPEAYYVSAKGKQGDALRQALFAIIDKHQVVSYDGLWKAYETTDVNAEGKPFCLYSEYAFEGFLPAANAKPGKIGTFLTREHSFPKDWWGGTNNPAFSDLFHVIVGDAHVNGQKGVKPLGEVGIDGKTFAISRVGPAVRGLDYTGEVFEPADRYKGDFARNYLYVALRYLTGPEALDCSSSPMVMPDGVTFKPWAIRLLKKWHRDDPPDDRERKRNDAVFALQKNRNPFIDHPEFVDQLWPEASGRGLWVGVDSSYTLGMEKAGKTWTAGDNKPADPITLLKSSGAEIIRVRLWTKDDGPNGLHETTALLKRAKAAGLKLYVTMFLSEDWADYIKQPAPKAWHELSLDERAAAIKTYAARVSKHFQDAGLDIAYYEIGNEIDFGICGVFEEAWEKRVSIEFMKAEIWPKMAKLIAAAQGGIKSTTPKTKFILHLTQWWNAEYATEFYKFMGSHGVTVDVAGLSYFPTSNLTKDGSLKEFLRQSGAIASATRRPIMICETGFPTLAKFPGQFAEWNQPLAGYELNEQGQAAWFADLIHATDEAGFVDAIIYWSPEWYESEIWSPFALFDSQGKTRPALQKLQLPKPLPSKDRSK